MQNVSVIFTFIIMDLKSRRIRWAGSEARIEEL